MNTNKPKRTGIVSTALTVTATKITQEEDNMLRSKKTFGMAFAVAVVSLLGVCQAIAQPVVIFDPAPLHPLWRTRT